jgi:zinc transport system permease protein
MPDFIVFALLVGCGVAVMSGPLGSFAVWRRMAYFGDTLAHSALMGVAFGLLLSININLAITLCCLSLALVLVVLQNNREIATDTLLGILSHSTLALGLIVVSLFGDGRIDLYAYLFGDLLAASMEDVITIAITGLIVIPIVIALWRPLLAITVHEELARVEGIKVTFVRTCLMLLMALVIAVAMKVVGVLLITALLIIPAAASRRLSHTPEQMAVMASALGCMAVIGGLGLSYLIDTPAGPSIVLCCSAIFCLSLLKPQPAST